MVSKKALENKEGFIVRLASFRDNDLMVTSLGPDGFFSFLARGGKKEGSKNFSSLGLLSYSTFSLIPNGASFSLSEGKLLVSPPYKDDLGVMSSLSFLAEISSKLVGEEEAPESFKWLKGAMEALSKDFSPFTLDLIVLAHFLINLGYGLELDSCVNCGKKMGIVGVSYELGGFLCKEEDEISLKKYSPRSLNILRYAFKCSLNDLSRVPFGKEETLEIIKDLGEYAEEGAGVTLRSLPILLKS